VASATVGRAVVGLWQGGGEGAAAVLCGYARQQDTEHAGVKGEDNPAAYLFISV